MKTFIYILLSTICLSSCLLNNGKTEEELLGEWKQLKQVHPDALGEPYFKSGIYYVESNGTSGILKTTQRDSSVSMYVNQEPIVTSAELIDVEISNNYNNYFVNVSYNGTGARNICEATTKQFEEQGQLAFIIDNVLISAPRVISGPICAGEISISGINNIEMAFIIQSLLRKEMRDNQ